MLCRFDKSPKSQVALIKLRKDNNVAVFNFAYAKCSERSRPRKTSHNSGKTIDVPVIIRCSSLHVVYLLPELSWKYGDLIGKRSTFVDFNAL